VRTLLVEAVVGTITVCGHFIFFFYIIMNNELRINITGVVYQEGGGVQFTCVYV